VHLSEGNILSPVRRLWSFEIFASNYVTLQLRFI